MKPCRHCGKMLEDHTRFCLFCMSRQEKVVEIENFYLGNFRFRKFWTAGIAGTVTVLLIVFLIAAVSQREIFESTQNSSESMEGSVDSVGEFSLNTELSKPLASYSSAIESEVLTESNSLQNSFSDGSLNLKSSSPALSESDSSHISSQGKERIMSAQEMVEDIMDKERAVMAEKNPGLVWTDEDLGAYSYVMDSYIYYGIKTFSEWEADYAVNGSPMDLVSGTEYMLKAISEDGFGVKGKYHWKVIECKRVTDDIGTELYFLKVRIQRQLREVDSVAYGIQTLDMIHNVRAELSRNLTRIDVLPQYQTLKDAGLIEGECLFISVYYDDSGKNDQYPSNQRELEQEVVQEIRSLNPSSLYDVRYLRAKPIQQENVVCFEFAVFIK